MNAAVKLVIGLVFFVVGVYWYAAPLFGHTGISSLVPTSIGSTFQAFLVVFFGLFGALLIALGLLVSWIEVEDIKWSSKEKPVALQEAKVPKLKVRQK